LSDKAEEKVSEFYNTVGWETEGNITEDARQWEDLREFSQEYISKCRLRLLKYIPESGGNILDMASGPIQYPEYLEYSKNFNKRYCVDLSDAALESAKLKIGEHGVFLHGSFFDISLDEDFFDCSISLHTIYHMAKDRQEEAVRKLLYVTKVGKPVIILYSNPNAFFPRLIRRIRVLSGKSVQEEDNNLYFYQHPNEWWFRFCDISDVEVLPWRPFSAKHQQALIPNNKLGKLMLRVLFSLETRFLSFFSKHFTYTMIILTKKKVLK